MPRSVSEFLREFTAALKPVAGDSAGEEAILLLEEISCHNRSFLYTTIDFAITGEMVNKAETILQKRLRGEPMGYVLGHSFFYKKEFFVSREVLIPRQDTETLIETVLSFEKENRFSVLDMGTGSGILAETIKNHRLSWDVFASDISPGALIQAKKNCSPAIPLFCCDRLMAIKPGPIFDFIVSNPPYIAEHEFRDLDKSVTGYEPHIALSGGKDGLYFYNYLAGHASRYLKPGGRIYCEIGYTQEDATRAIFRQAGWRYIRIFRDLGHRARVIRAVVYKGETVNQLYS